MDPLSITASAITLIDTATGIYRFFDSIRRADKGFAALCIELRTLTGFLKSIDKTHDDFCRNPLLLVSVDRDLWEQSRIALTDCQQTLDQLTALIDRMRGPNRSSTNLFRRTKLAADLCIHARDVVAFRDKIHMSNISLQTVLQVINLSLSFRQNTSQEGILQALQELNKHLQESDRAASHPYSTCFLDPEDRHLVANLKGLVRAAQNFHVSATSTASSIRDVQQHQQQHRRQDSTRSSYGGAESAILPKIPSIKKRQIHMFLSKGRQPARAGSKSLPKVDADIPPPITAFPDYPEVVDPEPQDSFDINFDNLFSKGLSKLAQRALQELKFPEAEKILRQALTRHRTTGPDDFHHKHLRAQLAMCNLLNGNVKQAEDLILDMAEFGMSDDFIMNQLLYALALAQIHECKFAETVAICKRLWQSLQNSDQLMTLKENDMWRLLAISHRESGAELLSEAMEEIYPDLDLTKPLATVGEYITDCEELLVELFSLGKAIRAPSLLVHRMKQLPVLRRTTPLQKKLAERSSRQADSAICMSDCETDAEDKAPIGVHHGPNYEGFYSPSGSEFDKLRFGRSNSLKRARSIFSSMSKKSKAESVVNNQPRIRSFRVKEAINKLWKGFSKGSHCGVDDIVEDIGHVLLASTAIVFFPIAIPALLYRRWRFLRRVEAGTVVSENENRIISWMRGQDSNKAPTVTTETTEDACDGHGLNSLQRRFSFEGLPGTPIMNITAPGVHEMPDTPLVELMDTSPRVELGDTSLTPIDIIKNHTRFPSPFPIRTGSPSGPLVRLQYNETRYANNVSDPSAPPDIRLALPTLQRIPTIQEDTTPCGAYSLRLVSDISEYTGTDDVHGRQISGISDCTVADDVAITVTSYKNMK